MKVQNSLHRIFNSCVFPFFYSRKSIPKFFYKLYQHLRDKDDEINEDDDNDIWHHDQTKRLNSNLHAIDGITGEHARVIEESDIITTFLNKNGKNEKKY